MHGAIPEAVDFGAMEAKAAEVARVLAALANPRRLELLCVLIEMGEANVGTLVDRVGAAQSAVSQHLARMRAEGVVAFRREGQTLWYRIADDRIEALIAELHRVYCRPAAPRGDNPRPT